MAKQIINIGSGELTGDGESLRSAFDKINDNFDEVYTGSGTTLGSDTTPALGGNLDLSGNDITGTGNLNITGNITATGSISASVDYSNLTSTPTTLAGYGIADAYTQTQVDTAITNATSSIVIPSGSAQSIDVVAQDSTVLVDSVNGTLNATTLTGALPAIDGSSLTGVTTAFSNITSTPTTLAGYGITDATSSASPAFTGAVDFTGTTSVDFTGATVNGLTVTETDPVVGAITGIVKADGAGNISAAVAGTDYLTTVAFADLTGKPTTVAGYGITDAFDGAFGSLSGTPTTLAGYGITDAATLNNMAPTGAVDFTGATSVDFTGATITALDSSGLTKPIDLDDNEEVRFGTDNDMRIYHSGTTGNIDNNTGSLIIDGSTVRIQDGALANTAISAANGIATLYHTNTAVLNTTAGGIKIEKGVLEKFATTNSATGVTALDCSTGHVHYLTGASGDITANFTNLNLTVEYATNITVIINQGATPYEVTAVQIGGAAQTINWQGGVAPTGNANGIDSFSFTILNDGGAYVVLGQMVDFT